MAVLPVPSHDDQWKDFSGLYSKGLKQSHPGIPDRTVYAAFIKEMDRGVAAGAALPVSPPLFEPAQGVEIGGTTKNGPQGSFAAQPIGNASSTYSTVKPPTVGDDEYAVELAELYWASLLRDVPFTEFADNTSNALIKAAVKDLNDNIARYPGPVDASGKVTPRLLFRGGLPKGKRAPGKPAYFSDEASGPYVSQFCLLPTNLGAQPIDQKMQTYAAGQDFMIGQDEWFKVQQGLPTGRSVMIDPIRRYMRNGRAFGTYTRQDELYQAYFIAFLVLKSIQMPANPGDPIRWLQKPTSVRHLWWTRCRRHFGSDRKSRHRRCMVPEMGCAPSASA